MRPSPLARARIVLLPHRDLGEIHPPDLAWCAIRKIACSAGSRAGASSLSLSLQRREIGGQHDLVHLIEQIVSLTSHLLVQLVRWPLTADPNLASDILALLERMVRPDMG